MMVFSLTNVMSGDPVEAISGGTEASLTPEAIEAAARRTRAQFPLPVQYLNWLADAVRGDLGNSITTRRPVSETIIDRLPTTLQLALVAWFIGVAISLPLGILAA